MKEEEMLQKKIWAVVGASENTEKYGYMIYKKLKALGYEVYPVNPNCTTIDGDKCFPNLACLPRSPQVVDMVVPPKHGLKILEQAASLGIKNIWLQPGSESFDLLMVADSLGLNTVQACVLAALPNVK